MQQLEPFIRASSVRMIDAFARDSRADLVAQLAYELPALVIFRMLGIPDQDAPSVKAWANSRVLLNFGDLPAQEQVEHRLQPGEILAVLRAPDRQPLRPAYRRPPRRAGADLPGGRFIDQPARDRLALLRPAHRRPRDYHQPAGQRPEGAADPPRAVGGALRRPEPHPQRRRGAAALWAAGLRVAAQVKRDTQVAEVDLPAGSNVLLLLGSANRDERAFAEAEQLDVRRANAKEHLSFGFGIHYCLGAPLARLEARIVLEELTRSLPGLRLVPGQTFAFSPNTSFRGPEHVWVEWDVLAPYVLPFEQCGQDDLDKVGGKCTSLGAMLRAGAAVPPGFAVTTAAYRSLLEAEGIREGIHELIAQIVPDDVASEQVASQAIRALIESAPMPAAVAAAIRDAYADLCARVGVPDLPVAVRSSATAEDLPNASFAGQQDTFLWVVGADAVVAHVRRCWSSLFTTRAIAYRADRSIGQEQVLMSVAVQKMVNARAAGVAMTLNPLDGDRSKIVIDASWGLGEAVVSGQVTPDNFVLDKVMLEVVKRTVVAKPIELVADSTGRRVVERPVDPERQHQPSLTNEELLAVARLAKHVERHYGTPQDIEWAVDADLPDGENIVLLQSRPETVWSQKAAAQPTDAALYQTGMQSLLQTLLNPLNRKK